MSFSKCASFIAGKANTSFIIYRIQDWTRTRNKSKQLTNIKKHMFANNKRQTQARTSDANRWLRPIHCPIRPKTRPTASMVNGPLRAGLAIWPRRDARSVNDFKYIAIDQNGTNSTIFVKEDEASEEGNRESESWERWDRKQWQWQLWFHWMSCGVFAMRRWGIRWRDFHA